MSDDNSSNDAGRTQDPPAGVTAGSAGDTNGSPSTRPNSSACTPASSMPVTAKRPAHANTRTGKQPAKQEIHTSHAARPQPRSPLEHHAMRIRAQVFGRLLSKGTVHSVTPWDTVPAADREMWMTITALVRAGSAERGNSSNR